MTPALVKQVVDVAINLINSRLKVIFNYYIGNGEYGTSNPNVLTFDSQLKILILVSEIRNNYIYTLFNSSNSYYAPYAIADELTQNFEEKFLMVSRTDIGAYGCKISSDKKQLSWYHTSGEQYQFNNLNSKYYYIAICDS